MLQVTTNKKETILKRILYGCIAIYIGTLLYAFYQNLISKDFTALGMNFVAILTPLLVPIAFKLLRFKPVYEIYILSTVFVYFASLIGSSYHWYSYTGFDKVLHFSSGWFATTIAVILYFYIKKKNTFQDIKEFHIFLIFINAVNMAIAEIWEFYEYGMLIFFNNDCINHYTQGVHDSITDVLVATLGGILLTILIVRYHKNGKANFFTNIYEKFYVYNIEDKGIAGE